MGEEVTKPIVLFTPNEDGTLHVEIDGFPPIMLWGIARMIERHADQIDFQASVVTEQKKPRIVRA